MAVAEAKQSLSVTEFITSERARFLAADPDEGCAAAPKVGLRGRVRIRVRGRTHRVPAQVLRMDKQQMMASFPVRVMRGQLLQLELATREGEVRVLVSVERACERPDGDGCFYCTGKVLARARVGLGRRRILRQAIEMRRAAAQGKPGWYPTGVR